VAARARFRAVVLLAAVGISLIGAVIWSRTVASDDAESADAVLDTPGEYLEPGTPTNPPLPVDRLPAIELTTADGQPAVLTSDGRPMVINLWYSTCAPCERELVELASVEADLGEFVRFVGVNPLDSPETMNEFAAARDVTYELLRDPESALADELAIVAYPVTLFVGRDGAILERTGPVDAADVRQRIAEYWAVG
jgi:thiol-disulfide isomerase/thioredoxin